MTAPHADQLIDGYLARIAAAASDFPDGARDELLDDMRSHVAEARSREPEETDASILNILDRLGEPSVVVGDARERLGIRKEPASWMKPGLLEIAALVLLLFLYPAGLILLWLSSMWKTSDKIIGSIFTLGGYPGIFIVGAMVARPLFSFTFSGSLILLIALTVGFFLLPIITVAYLATRLTGRRRMTHAAA
jgi:hypothetical protein